MRFSVSLVVLAALFATSDQSTQAIQLVKKHKEIPIIHRHQLGQKKKEKKHKKKAPDVPKKDKKMAKEVAKEEKKVAKEEKKEGKELKDAAKEVKEIQKLEKKDAKEEKKAVKKEEEKKPAPKPKEKKQHKHKKPAKGGDKYGQVNEYETDFKAEAGGYNMGPVENFGRRENENLPTPLDGELLTKEIGGASLTAELNDRDNGAGIKDKEDLADLLASVKGAQTFMNKTPKEQL